MEESVYRILLVDDEGRVLRALARRLASFHSNWEVVTATSGAEALEMLSQHKHHLVVSDLQMPLMDGGTFLSKVRQDHPGVVRFALSGHAQQSLMLKAISLAHQYFAKPCDSETLAHAIDKALREVADVTEQKLQEIVIQVNQFYPFSEIFTKLETMLDDPHASIDDMSNLIVQDPAITAKILQVANSSFFGAGQKVSVLGEAVTLLGADTIRSLLMIFNMMVKPREDSYARELAQKVWEHSLGVSALACEVAADHFQTTSLAPRIRTLGILHDMGMVLFAELYGQRYQDAIELSRSSNTPLWFAEQQEFSFSHPQLASTLFKLWGMPDELTDAVLWHHQPINASCANPQALAAVHIADVLDYVAHNRNMAALDRLDKDFLQKLNLPSDNSFWESWLFKHRSELLQ